jgi:hypothetical protein
MAARPSVEKVLAEELDGTLQNAETMKNETGRG